MEIAHPFKMAAVNRPKNMLKNRKINKRELNGIVLCVEGVKSVCDVGQLSVLF